MRSAFQTVDTKGRLEIEKLTSKFALKKETFADKKQITKNFPFFWELLRPGLGHLWLKICDHSCFHGPVETWKCMPKIICSLPILEQK